MRGLDETCVNKEKCEPSVACTRTRDWWKAHWDRLTYAPGSTVGLLVNENVKHDLHNDAPKSLLVHLLKP
jgi:hypothetical protein